jgi:hypothetical protein
MLSIHETATILMPQPTAAEQFNPHNLQFTADQFFLLTQMRADAPVTFQPALHVYAVWQAMSVRPTKPLTF